MREAPSRALITGTDPVLEMDPAALAHPPGGKPRKAKKKRRGKDRQSQLPLPSASGAGWDARATPWSGKIAVLVCAKILELSAALSPLRSGCSRPMLMSGVGRQWQSGGQRTIKVSILHERRDQVARAIRQINGEIGQIRPITGAYAPKV